MSSSRSVVSVACGMPWTLPPGLRRGREVDGGCGRRAPLSAVVDKVAAMTPSSGPPAGAAPGPSPAAFDAATAAVEAALGAGARYADARVVHTRYESMAARNGDIEDLSQAETIGVGVRALV